MTQHRNALIVGSVALALAVLFSALRAEPTHASAPGHMKIKLYDQGKVVGEWTSENIARVDGGTLVFTVRDGVRSQEVRIGGTFSAQQID